jgi:hypothetical protein
MRPPQTEQSPEEAFVLECLTQQYTPLHVPPIAEWIRNQRLEITADQNPTYAGQVFDPDRFPAVSKLVFKFFETPGAFELFTLKPVQSTFTTHVWFAMCHAFIYRPCTAILVMHTRQEVRKKKKDTYKPLIDAIPDLANSERLDGTETTAEEFRFQRSNLYVGGGQSASVLTSTSANIVVLDEAEQHKTVGDTTTISLARGRITAGSQWRKLCAFSKPEKEARFDRDPKTGNLWYIPEEGTYLHAEYLSGNQMRYECRCPHCEEYTEPSFDQIRFGHCRVSLPGMADQWDKHRILRETHWACPHCQGVVHEGEEKKRWVMEGRWVETPTDQRKAKDMYPMAHPGRWSAQFSGLVDIAFDSLTWGNLVLRFLDAQNDPVKLRAFNNEILGLPEPTVRTDDTTQAHLRRLIPSPGSADPQPWNYRDENGNLTGTIPLLSTQVAYIGMTADNQKDSVKYRVRAVGHDGRSYLLDYGAFPATPEFAELRSYLDTQKFTTLDGVSSAIYRCYIDIQGSRWFDSIDLCLADYPRIVGVAGAKQNMQSSDRLWPVKVNSRSGKALYVLYFDSNFWEGRLYRDVIQHFDPKRHRPYAPAMYFPRDVGDDYLIELMQMREVWKNRRMIWEKVSASAVNDFGDCEKIGLIQDWCLRQTKESAA